RRRQFAAAHVQREHQRRLMRFLRKRIVNEPPCLLRPLPHSGFVLGEIVDEPHRSEPRRARGCTTHGEEGRQLAYEQRSCEDAEKPGPSADETLRGLDPPLTRCGLDPPLTRSFLAASP